jgi:hypothetical protein
MLTRLARAKHSSLLDLLTCDKEKSFVTLTTQANNNYLYSSSLKLQQNKLVCFSLTNFKASLIYASKAKVYIHTKALLDLWPFLKISFCPEQLGSDVD